jgi:hypothetical protein
MDRETGPDPTASADATVRDGAVAEGPQDYPAPSRAIMAGLSADPRLPVWIRRAFIAAVIAIIVSLWQNWRWGLTAAAAVAIFDTIYHSKTMGLIPAAARVTSAQRRTRRRLFLARPFGYLSVHARAIPGSNSVIDHLVVGPGGVFAVDSERWDRRLPIRTVATNSAAGPVLYHGPFSQKDRLAHARWEAAQASRLLSAELGREVQVHPAMVIYGPTVPWAVATIRGVDVFSGRSVGSYFRSRSRIARSSRRLGWEEAGEIHNAAQSVLPYS